MQSIKTLEQHIRANTRTTGNLFSTNDLRAILSYLPLPAFRMLLSRAVGSGVLERVCRGLYLYPHVPFNRGLVLYKAVTKLRPLCLNYLSLESVLSDAGVISQILINRLTIMSSGRSSIIKCGTWGTLEFVHTRQEASSIALDLIWDTHCELWRAKPVKAFQDLVWARRSLDLVDQETLREFV